MNLGSNQKGYAVMSNDLSGISLDGYDLEALKKYCCGTDVIVERIPVVCGFGINIYIFPDFTKPIRINRMMSNILWLHVMVMKKYRHRCGEIVYRSVNNHSPLPEG